MRWSLWPLEVDSLDVGPRHMLGAIAAVEEDQHASIRLVQVSAALELQNFAAQERQFRALSAGHIAGHDRGNDAEGDHVIDTLRRRIERLGGFAVVEVENQTAGEPAAGASGDVARERAPRLEIAIRWCGTDWNEIDAFECIR